MTELALAVTEIEGDSLDSVVADVVELAESENEAVLHVLTVNELCNESLRTEDDDTVRIDDTRGVRVVLNVIVA